MRNVLFISKNDDQALVNNNCANAVAVCDEFPQDSHRGAVARHGIPSCKLARRALCSLMSRASGFTVSI